MSHAGIFPEGNGLGRFADMAESHGLVPGGVFAWDFLCAGMEVLF